MRLAYFLAAVLAVTGCARGDASDRLILGTTHTLQDSGVLDSITAAFAREHPQLRLSVVVAGSGEILAMARRGDVDIVLSHSPEAEQMLVSDGVAESREHVMHNDFVILGPTADPAHAAEAASAPDALMRIASTGQPFVSRGDDSGTHVRELALWSLAGGRPQWDAYIEAGSGMADALRLASQRGAYIMADRATWMVLRESLELTLVKEGGTEMRNDYSVLVVANARALDAARSLAQWLTGPTAQRIIGEYRAPGAASPLFTPASSDRSGSAPSITATSQE